MTELRAEVAVDAPRYRPDVDGLRAVAVLAVVVFHAWPSALPGGFVGVDVFFVISGFLITQLILDGIGAARFSFAEFYARRVRRIVPALAIVLAWCVVYGYEQLPQAELSQLLAHAIAGALSFANVWSWRQAGYFDGAAELKPLLHLWSLGVEEQFYMLWPALLVATRGGARRVRTVMLSCVVASFLLNVVLVQRFPVATFYLPMTRLWELALGGLLVGIRTSSSDPQATRPARARAAVMTGAGAVLLALGVLYTDAQKAFPGYWAILPTAGTALMIAAGPRAWLNRWLLASPPLVQLGLISYPLYLWHWPLLAFERILGPWELLPRDTVGPVALSFVLAWLTYRVIERPIRRAPASPRVAFGLLAALSAVALASLACYLGVVPMRPDNQSELRRAGITLDRAIRRGDHAQACDGAIDTPASLRELCTFAPGPRGAKTIVLWGDSHAGAWSPLFFDVGRKLGYRVVVIEHDGCVPLLHVKQTSMMASPACRDFGLAEDALRAIAALRPVHVFVVARWSVYAHGWRVAGHLQPRTHFLTQSDADDADEASSIAAMRAQFPRTSEALRKLASVTFVKTVPAPEPSPVADTPRSAGPELARSRGAEAFGDELIDEAVARDPGVTAVDVAPRLCRPTCVTARDGMLLYQDDNHLTAQATLLFADAISALLPHADLAAHDLGR
jgi:peptidoglycan/LPS O-acetylase OafA/YrhL